MLAVVGCRRWARCECVKLPYIRKSPHLLAITVSVSLILPGRVNGPYLRANSYRPYDPRFEASSPENSVSLSLILNKKKEGRPAGEAQTGYHTLETPRGCASCDSC